MTHGDEGKGASRPSLRISAMMSTTPPHDDLCWPVLSLITSALHPRHSPDTLPKHHGVVSPACGSRDPCGAPSAAPVHGLEACRIQYRQPPVPAGPALQGVGKAPAHDHNRCCHQAAEGPASPGAAWIMNGEGRPGGSLSTSSWRSLNTGTPRFGLPDGLFKHRNTRRLTSPSLSAW